jgi:hypothetical protein
MPQKDGDILDYGRYLFDMHPAVQHVIKSARASRSLARLKKRARAQNFFLRFAFECVFALRKASFEEEVIRGKTHGFALNGAARIMNRFVVRIWSVVSLVRK